MKTLTINGVTVYVAGAQEASAREEEPGPAWRFPGFHLYLLANGLTKRDLVKLCGLDEAEIDYAIPAGCKADREGRSAVTVWRYRPGGPLGGEPVDLEYLMNSRVANQIVNALTDYVDAGLQN